MTRSPNLTSPDPGPDQIVNQDPRMAFERLMTEYMAPARQRPNAGQWLNQIAHAVGPGLAMRGGIGEPLFGLKGADAEMQSGVRNALRRSAFERAMFEGGSTPRPQANAPSQLWTHNRPLGPDFDPFHPDNSAANVGGRLRLPPPQDDPIPAAWLSDITLNPEYSLPSGRAAPGEIGDTIHGLGAQKIADEAPDIALAGLARLLGLGLPGPARPPNWGR